jgi:hypothetical protein
MARLRLRWVGFGSTLLLMLLLPGIAAVPQETVPPPSSAQIEDVERQLGPFEVSNQQFTVILRMKRAVTQGPVLNPDFQETLSGIEIKDAGGVVHYENTFAVPEIADGSFVETTSLFATPVQGEQGNGLLITYSSLPSTPLGGSSWQVFGLSDGKLVPFNKPLYLEGDLMATGDAGEAIQTSQESTLQGDVLNFRVWTGNFFAVIPLKIDWLLGRFAPAWQCHKMTGQGVQPLCQVRVEAERVAQEDDMTFVRLHEEPEEGFGSPAHVVVRKYSQIEFLAAETEVIWDEDANGVGLTVADDVWLKLRIDGKEGWVHTQEDFTAIGLPQAG